MKKYCTKCGKPFEAVGREVICPDCKQAAAEESKKAAVLKAKRASWAGESVPVRISGRASTVIRAYGKHYNLPFAAALDDLLKASEFFKSIGVKWEEVKPYKSRRRDKHTTETEDAQEVKTAQDTASKPQDVQAAQEVKQEEVKTAAGKSQEAPQASKPQEVTKAAKVAKTTSKASTSKATTSKAGKAASKKG